MINLSNECYLEIIAIDPDHQDVQRNRWMGIDLLESPKLIRWAIKSDNLQNDQTILRKFNSEMGKIQPGSRQTASGNLLKWELIMPLSTPEVEVIPFVLDWSQSEMHPTEVLEPTPFKLKKIQLTHPEPEKISQLLNELDVKAALTKGVAPTIHAQLQGANGIPIII